MKSLFPIKPTEEQVIEAVRLTISKMALEPGDIIVLRHPRPIRREVAENMRSVIRQVLGGHKCLILDDGLDIAILSKAEIERQLGIDNSSSREVADH